MWNRFDERRQHNLLQGLSAVDEIAAESGASRLSSVILGQRNSLCNWSAPPSCAEIHAAHCHYYSAMWTAHRKQEKLHRSQNSEAMIRRLARNGQTVQVRRCRGPQVDLHSMLAGGCCGQPAVGLVRRFFLFHVMHAQSQEQRSLRVDVDGPALTTKRSAG